MFGKRPARSSNNRKHSIACGLSIYNKPRFWKATLEREERLLDELARLKGEDRNGNNQ